jgi:hypothetical protein
LIAITPENEAKIVQIQNLDSTIGAIEKDIEKLKGSLTCVLMSKEVDVEVRSEEL